MNKFTREDVITLLKMVIFIALIIVAIKFFIKLLPLIIVVLIGVLVYDSLKKNGFFTKNKKNNEDGIVEAKIIKEKKNN